MDLGTGSAKALLLSQTGGVEGEGSASYEVSSPYAGWAESSPEDWWSAAATASRQAVGERAGEVAAIGLSGQMHGVVACDASGRPLYPAILWADARSRKRLRDYYELSSELRRALANPITTGMAGPTLLWLRENEPRVYERLRWALQPKDWLKLRLTGEATGEPSDASATLLYDLADDGWSYAVAEELGLRGEALPPLLPSAAFAGELTREAANHLGLPAGLPVAAGAADTAASALGSGLIEPGQAQLTVGTGAQILVIRDEPEPDATGRTHLYRAAAPGLWYAMAAMQNAGLALEKVLKLLGVSWEDLYRQAFSVDGSRGVTFLPYVSGERTPHFDSDARAAWLGVGLQHERAHLLRASLEGVAFSIKDGLEALQGSHPIADALPIAGGGALDARWRQLLCDVLGRPLLSLPVASASARGAAILAGIASGAFEDARDSLRVTLQPIPDVTPVAPEAYEQAFLDFRGAYENR